MLNGTLKRMRTFAHGVHPPEEKEGTRSLAIRRMPFPHLMVIPLSQHTGAPAQPIVREGQEVVRGEPIAVPTGFVSIPMHAPATGEIERIGLAPDARGSMSPAIYLRLYPGASQEILFGGDINYTTYTKDELIKAVQDTGIVGLGGAAFPTHVKLKVPEGKHIDTIIANGCECEPYLTTDHRVMLEYPHRIMKGIGIVMRAMGAERAIIGLEENKLDAADALRNAIPADLPVTVEVVETKYPQGAEKMLVKALLDREVPSGGLPSDAGVGVFNVATLAQIGELVPRRQGLIERVVTVAGPGVRKPGNYLMPLGAKLSFVLQQAGVYDDAAHIMLGGPMMGVPVSSLDIPVTKGVTGILAFRSHPVNGKYTRREFPCIRCGWCVDACPIFLNPCELAALAKNRRYEAMETQYHLNDCFECGACAYVCPSNIPLVQHFRVAKAMNRERKART